MHGRVCVMGFSRGGVYIQNIWVQSVLTEKKVIQFKQKRRKITFIVKISFWNQQTYSLYKKKRKDYILFDNLGTFKDKHFKLTGYLDWYVPYQ